MFLTLNDFLAKFPPIKISRDEFINRFTVMYKQPVTLKTMFTLGASSNNIKPIIKGPTDKRYIRREEIIDYFYEIVIVNRAKYLTFFYNSFFNFQDPRNMKWDGISIMMDPPGTNKAKSIHINNNQLSNSLSLQKNDKSRIMVRNLFYNEILNTTRITNTVKDNVSFWQTLDNLYNKLQLEDRFFAPSSIDLFLRDKIVWGVKDINYNNLFYLFQQYQPKASILNPYAINWIFKNILPGKKIFTPVLSWSSYLIAFMHSPYEHYVGVDVIPDVCTKCEFLADYYRGLGPEFKKKKVDILCQPSESLLKNHNFMANYHNYFDTILICPPYFDMEIYKEGEQSTKNYPQYPVWLEKYWHNTVKVCYHVLRKGGKFAVIANDYYNLNKEFYNLTQDLDDISSHYFKLINTYYLYNRTSPLRINNKDRTERLFIYQKE